MTESSTRTGANSPTDGHAEGPAEPIEQLGINVIRGLAMDAPRKANSGHPGTAMALAPLAHVLWTRVMHYDPPTPTGPTGTASCSPAGTPRSCCTPCCTLPATA